MSSPLLSCQDVNKAFGTRILFKDLSLTISRGDRIGMIGPNGSGKSTLLKLLARLESPDSGTISCKRDLRLGYVPQDSTFPDLTLEEVLLQAFDKNDAQNAHERHTQVRIMLSKMGFNNPSVKATTLSGGWKKRLDIAKELIKNPDILFLDEPTNHLDLEGINWLESFLQRQTCAYLIISHDRYFLQNVTNRMMELNKSFPNGIFSIDAPYNTFVEKKAEYLQGQLQYERSLNSKVRYEIEWLKQTPQARTTKSTARIQEAERLIQELSDVKTRNKSSNIQIDFASTERQTRKLIAVKNLSKKMGERVLFSGIGFTLSPGSRLGLVGPNGSGKTTLLKMLAGILDPDMGTIKIGDGVKVVYFDQHRQQLPRDVSLRQALAGGSDTVNYRGQTIHVNSWCKRFLFSPSHLDLPINQFSGGERARILIARLMLQPADVLLLDEPTNDLDIPTLEILEDSLREFPGALVLITHDRYMLQQLCNGIIGVGPGNDASIYADYAQWETAMKASKSAPPKIQPSKSPPKQEATQPKKLTYNEKREWEQMEGNIHACEEEIEKLHKLLEQPAIANDPVQLEEICSKLSIEQEKLDALFARWQELELKVNAER